jgi:hypothetical protein
MKFGNSIALVIMTICIVGMVWWDSQSYDNAYEQGRMDKYAEMMESLTGDPEARIAIVANKKITYHPAGICATCHGG